jgi:hypothetical protein
VNPSAGDTASAAVGRELSQTGAMMTGRNMNVQPTIKVSVGYKFTAVSIGTFFSKHLMSRGWRTRSRYHGSRNSGSEVQLL